METTIANTSDINLTNLNLVTDAGEKKGPKSQAADSFKAKMSGIATRESQEGIKKGVG